MAMSTNTNSPTTTTSNMGENTPVMISLYCFRGTERLLYGVVERKKLVQFSGLARPMLRSKSMVNTTIPPNSIELPKSFLGLKDVVESVCGWINAQDLNNKTPMTIAAVQAANPDKKFAATISNMALLYRVGHDLGISREHRGDHLRDGIHAAIKAEKLTPPQFETIRGSLRFDEGTIRKAVEETVKKYSKGEAKKDAQLAADYEAIKVYARTHQLGSLLAAIEEQVKNEKVRRQEGFRQAGLACKRQERWEARQAARLQRQARVEGPGDVNSKEEYPSLS